MFELHNPFVQIFTILLSVNINLYVEPTIVNPIVQNLLCLLHRTFNLKSWMFLFWLFYLTKCICVHVKPSFFAHADRRDIFKLHQILQRVSCSPCGRFPCECSLSLHHCQFCPDTCKVCTLTHQTDVYISSGFCENRDCTQVAGGGFLLRCVGTALKVFDMLKRYLLELHPFSSKVV